MKVLQSLKDSFVAVGDGIIVTIFAFLIGLAANLRLFGPVTAAVYTMELAPFVAAYGIFRLSRGHRHFGRLYVAAAFTMIVGVLWFRLAPQPVAAKPEEQPRTVAAPVVIATPSATVAAPLPAPQPTPIAMAQPRQEASVAQTETNPPTPQPTQWSAEISLDDAQKMLPQR